MEVPSYLGRSLADALGFFLGVISQSLLFSALRVGLVLTRGWWVGQGAGQWQWSGPHTSWLTGVALRHRDLIGWLFQGEDGPIPALVWFALVANHKAALVFFNVDSVDHGHASLGPTASLAWSLPPKNNGDCPPPYSNERRAKIREKATDKRSRT